MTSWRVKVKVKGSNRPRVHVTVPFCPAVTNEEGTDTLKATEVAIGKPKRLHETQAKRVNEDKTTYNMYEVKESIPVAVATEITRRKGKGSGDKT